MAFKKLTNYSDVEREFKSRYEFGDEWLENICRIQYEDLPKLQESIEYLLETDYNTVSGFTFPELMEAASYVKTFTPKEYLREWKRQDKNLGVNESFIGTTQAQAPFPILNKGLVLYTYEKSVLPYLAHVFDLKANRGLAYYMELHAQNTPFGSAVNKGDLIASPISLSKQTTNFITSKITNAVVKTLVQGQDTYQIHLAATQADPNAVMSIQPQSLTVTVDGLAPAFLQDLSNDVAETSVYMTNVNGLIGQASVDLNTGIMTLVLAAAPSQSGGSIRATFNRDLETTAGGATNQAVVAPQLKSVQLNAEDFSVFTETNLHQQRLAQVIFGIDWNSEVDNLLGACYNREIANKVLSDIVANIPTGSIQSYDIGSNIGADNRYFNTSFVPVPIGTIHKMISKATGLTGGRKVSTYAANIDMFPILEHLPKFKSIETGENFMGGMALAGTYDGLPVIQAYAPILADAADGAEMVGIYKSKEKEFLTAAVVGQFILPVIRDIYDQNNLATNRKQLIASAAVKTVVPNLASKLIITGINTLL